MRWARASAVAVSFVVVAATLWPDEADAVTRIFAGGVDKVWKTARSVLESEGWDIDREDRVAGRILTDARDVDFRDFGVYAEGTRHRLTLTLRAAGAGRTAVTVERELFREERILWSRDRVPLRTEDSRIELGILHTIALVVPTAGSVAAAPPPAIVSQPERAAAAPPAPPPPPLPPAPSMRPERATPTAQETARTPRITYRVTGSGGAVQVTYRNAQGANDRQTASTLPWEVSFAGTGGTPLYVSAVAQGAASASVTCEILVDGTPRSQSMSVGSSVVATCSAPAP
jgi:MmpS family membrane protein